jgi:hypothetical protein
MIVYILLSCSCRIKCVAVIFNYTLDYIDFDETQWHFAAEDRGRSLCIHPAIGYSYSVPGSRIKTVHPTLGLLRRLTAVCSLEAGLMGCLATWIDSVRKADWLSGRRCIAVGKPTAAAYDANY